MLTYLPSKLLPALTAFISVPILTRLFLPADYGNWALADGVSAFLGAMAISGFGAGVIRFFSAYKVKSELSVFFATLGISTGVIIAAISAISFLALFLLRGILPAVLYPLFFMGILIFMVQAAFEVFMNVVRAQERSGLYTVFELSTRYGSLGLGLVLVIVFGFGVEGLMWGTLVAFALALPLLLFSTTRAEGIHPRCFRMRDALQMWRYSWPLAIGNMAMWGLIMSDRYVISFFRPQSEVGLYSVAYNISGKSIEMLVALFLLSMGPMLMNIWETQGREATEKALAMVTRLFLILCLPAAVGLSVLAVPFVSLLTAEAYHEGYRVVGYVAFSVFLWGFSQIASTGTLIGKKTRWIALNQIFAALINLGLNLLLVPRFGFVAAGITTLIGYAVLFSMQAYISHRYLRWLFPFKTFRNVVIAAICMGVAVLGVYGMSGNKAGVHLGYLFLSMIVAIIVYFLSLWLLGEANGEEKAIGKDFWHKLKFGDLGSKAD